MIKIYTKTGDKGETSLFDGTRVAKYHDRVSAYGGVDELNAYLGIVRVHIKSNEALDETFQNIQKDLFAVGAKLANPAQKKQKQKADFGEEKIVFLEEQIDKMEAKLKPLTNFILPGGSELAAHLSFARTLCRRVEREVVALSQKEEILETVVVYLNRLSDYLFVASRYANFLEDVEDVKW